jgi:hypothetical protein
LFTLDKPGYPASEPGTTRKRPRHSGGMVTTWRRRVVMARHSRSNHVLDEGSHHGRLGVLLADPGPTIATSNSDGREVASPIRGVAIDGTP